MGRNSGQASAQAISQTPYVPAEKGRRKKGGHPVLLTLLFLLLALVIFGCGFLLGRASAAQLTGIPAPADPAEEVLAAADPEQETLPEEPVPPDDPSPLEIDPEEEWKLILVNEQSPLPEDYQVPELIELRNGYLVDSRIYPDLQRMMDAARAEGYRPLVCSGFRSWEKQEALYLEEVRRQLARGYEQAEAEEEAARWIARPGTSEHQVGLAVDIVDENYQLLNEEQEKTPVQQWLMAHCAEYGFILRYPTEKGDLTGVGYEPWHYRYVGARVAGEIMEQGLCLEEYVAQLETEN